MNFKTWLEFQEKDFNYYKSLILGKLDLESPEGLSVTLDTFNTRNLIEELQGLGEFKELSSDIQQLILNKIRSGDGTIEDLIRIMADKST